MKIIPITQEEIVTVDDCDYEYLNQWKWQLHNAGYAIRSALKADNLPRGCKILMHRVILERAGFKDFATGDHKDHNRLNNRRTNLRPATKAQNACNIRKPKVGDSGVPGVFASHPKGKWCSSIKIEGVVHWLGTFDNLEEASAAYQVAKAKRDALYALSFRIGPPVKYGRSSRQATPSGTPCTTRSDSPLPGSP